ncbi:MAG: GAF domain-containing protein [Chloroflexi bacterium]|nr:GAF domain-containing protein [Chloroflexota bacterium]
MRDKRRWVRDLTLSVSVRIKILGIALGLTLLFGFAVILYVRTSLDNSLTRELEDKGASITSDLAARSADLILTNNLFALHELVRATLENNLDVQYAFILDPNGNGIVHSFSSGLSPALIAANTAAPNERSHLEVFETEVGTIRDFAVPIFGGKAGIARIGMSERRLHENISATTQQLLLITLFVSLIGVAAALWLTRAMTRPIFDLVGATRAVAGGDLSRRVTPWAGDEIGQLTHAFNAMTADLDRAYREMVQRNRELAALNAVASAVNTPAPLSETLERSLRALLDSLNLPAGWVFLLDRDSERVHLTTWLGLPREIGEREAETALHGCPCTSALRDKRGVVIAPLLERCPLRDARLGNARPVAAHATVPILAHDRALGVLGVASADAQAFSVDEMKLLEAVGQELGVAVENASLWNDLSEKERVRGQLLDKIISVQEEERQRVARELHDEMGQSLTSLLVGLKMVEESSSLDQAQTRAQELKLVAGNVLDDVRALARELRPSVLDDMGLVTALERYTREYAHRFNLAVDFQVVGLDGVRLPAQYEIALYRIVQEALTNIAKYASAKNVSVLLEHRRDSVVAIIEDDGRGFEVERFLRERRDGQHLGLLGMKERAELLGGKWIIESKIGEGTTVFAQLPVSSIP